MFILQNHIATTPQTLNHSSIALNTTKSSSSSFNSAEASALFFLAYLLILYVFSLWDYWIVLRVRESNNRRINSKTTLSYTRYGSMNNSSASEIRNNPDTPSDDTQSLLLSDSPPRQSSPLLGTQH